MAPLLGFKTSTLKTIAVVVTASLGGLCLQAAKFDLSSAFFADIQAAMEAGALSSESLTQMYLNRIEAYDQKGPKLAAVLYVKPNALEEAKALDAERAIFGGGGLGRETGFSIRTPMSDSDLYGLSTTSGLISRDGQMWSYMTGERGGPKTRSVADLAAGYEAKAGALPMLPPTTPALRGKAFDY